MRIVHSLALSLIAMIPAQAHASYVINVFQAGTNVVASGAGSINDGGLGGPLYGGSLVGYVDASRGQMVIGTGITGLWFGTLSSTTTFGDGGLAFPDVSLGYSVGFDFIDGFIALPYYGYGLAGLGKSISVYDNQTIASLGLTPGQYVLSWGTGLDADSLTLNIGSLHAVPEQATWVMMIMGFGAIGAVMRQRRRIRVGYA
jgi:hypothetical protein